MGSAPTHTNDSVVYKKCQSNDITFFKSQIQNMKYEKCKERFKIKSDETMLALGTALVNLKKNNLLNTGQFKKLQGNGKQKNKVLKNNSMKNSSKISTNKTLKDIDVTASRQRYTFKKHTNPTNKSKVFKTVDYA